jgi:hypothetical protein
LKGPDPRVRKVLNDAALHTVRAIGLPARVVDLPEGDEIEVTCAPLVPVPGARFFLRVELSTTPKGRARGTPPTASAAVPTPLLRSWRTVPEPVAVVGLDPRTGAGRLAEAHPFLAWLDRTHRGWDRAASVLVPLSHSIDGHTLPRLARAAADAHVLYRRVLDRLRRGGGEPAPRDLRTAAGRLQERDFDLTVACLDLLREAGLVEETHLRELQPTDSCTAAFSRAAVQHAVGARGHADPVSATEAGRSAVVRILQSRLPNLAESTLRRCAVVLARFLPVEDADAILDLAKDPDALAKALDSENGDVPK